MKKKYFITPLALMAALAMVSCSENESMPMDGTRTPLVVNAGIALQTRATDAAWQTGDVIAVFMTKAGTTEVVDNAANLPYNASGEGADVSFTPAGEVGTAYFPVEKAPVDIRAYYPHTTKTGTDGIVAVDVTDQSSLPKIDLMTAVTDEPHTSDNPAVPLLFRHRLSKMVVNIETEVSAANVDLTDAKLTLTGTAPKAAYSLFDDVLTPGTPAEISLALNKEGSKATAILVPTAAGSGVMFIIRTAEGKTFTAALPATTALVEGTMATVTIRLQQTAAVVEATITDWTDGPELEVQTLQIDIPVDETGVPAIKSFSLWKNNDEKNAVSYTWTDSRWTTDKAPFYVDDITAADRFNARHTPAKGSPEKDILTAGPVAAEGGRISLDFAHINSRLTVTLNPSATFPDVSAAKIFVTGLYGTDRYAVVSGKSNIFLPKTLTTTDKIVVEYNNTDYQIALTDITLKEGTLEALEAGEAYDIVLNIAKSGITATVTAKEWSAEAGSGEMLINIGADIIAKDIDGDGVLSITAQGRTGTYRYDADKDIFTPVSPLSWGDLTKGRVDFIALFSPDADGNPEKDIIRSATAVNWGEALRFPAFDHINTKLKITLRAGAGFDSTDDMTMTVSGLTIVAADYPMASGEAHIFTPKTLEPTDLIKVSADDFNYSMALSDIAIGASKLNRLEAGKAYNITLTVSMNGLNLAVTVNEWDEISGSGNIND